MNRTSKIFLKYIKFILIAAAAISAVCLCSCDALQAEQEITGCESSYTIDREESITIEPEAETEISYKSDNSQIAKVTGEGKITGVSGGTATITLTAQEDDDYQPAVKEIKITVNPYSTEEKQAAKKKAEKKKKKEKRKKKKEKSKNEQAIDAAIEWAVEIANDNSFHYGEESWAHHKGCYFCGTNQKNNSGKIKDGAAPADCAKTYVCNTFITAAFYHGAGSKTVDCKKNIINVSLKKHVIDTGLEDKPEEWVQMEKPDDFTRLNKGDLLFTKAHCMMYIGDGKVVESHNAGGEYDKGKKGEGWDDSITVRDLEYSRYKKVGQIWRFIGTGKF